METCIEAQGGKVLTHPKYPYFKIVINPDKMEARGVFSTLPKGTSASQLAARDILELLFQEGIQIGVLEKSIYNLESELRKGSKPPESLLLARGVFPGIHKDTPLTLKAKGITEEAQLAAFLESPIKHFSILEELGNFDRINKGMDILTLPRSPFAPGTDLYGSKVEVNSQVLFLQVGEGIVFDASRNTFVSNLIGVACLCSKKLQVIPVDYDARVSIEVSPDSQTAWANTLPAHPAGIPLTKKAILDSIMDAHVTTGIDELAIQDILRSAPHQNKKAQNILAQGKPPVDGKDGYIEWLINLDENLIPQIDENGKANFKHISLIKSVRTGFPLARLKPPVPGKPGRDVYGNPLPALEGVPVQFPLGKGSRISPTDPQVIEAETTGNVRLQKGLIEITECLLLEGNVDFASGNIDYYRTVKVEGDIKSGFTVKVGGDLEVNGLVEDASVQVEGRVLIQAGFLGNGSGVIDAKDNVALAYVRNQTVRSRKDIIVGGESINSHLYARGNIQVHGTTLGISGGLASAKNTLHCECAGNEHGIKTILEVGVDFALVDEKFKTEEKIRELNTSNLKLESHLGKLVRIQKIKKNLPDADKILLEKLLEMRTKINQQTVMLEDRLVLIKNKLMEISQSQIVVNKILWPGVTIKIGDVFIGIDRKMEGRKLFLLRDREIKIFST